MKQLKSMGSWFAYRIRENAKVYLEDGTMVKRNIYSHYVSNSNPVYCRHNNQTCFLRCENYQTDNEIFYITLRGRKH